MELGNRTQLPLTMQQRAQDFRFITERFVIYYTAIAWLVVAISANLKDAVEVLY